MANLVIKTEAQALLDLVRQKKRIALREAAGYLNQPVPTVQSWALFLEEENLLKIQYSLLKPYLISVPAKLSVEQKVETKTTELFPQLIIDITDLQKKLAQVPKDAEAESARIKENIEGTYNTLLRTSRAQVLEVSKAIEADIKNNHIRQARSKLVSLEQLQGVLKLLKHEDKILLAGDIERVEQTLVNAEAEILPKTFSEVQKKIDEELVKGNAAIQAKDWKIVDEVGAALLALKDDLPEELVDNYAVSVAKINHFLESWIQMRSHAMKADFTKKSAELQSSLAQSAKSVQGSRYAEAFDFYSKAHDLFDELPVGFLNERIAIHNQLVSLLATLKSPAPSAMPTPPVPKEAKTQQALPIIPPQPPKPVQANTKVIPQAPPPVDKMQPSASKPVLQPVAKQQLSTQAPVVNIPELLSQAEAALPKDNALARQIYLKIINSGVKQMASADAQRLGKLYLALK